MKNRITMIAAAILILVVQSAWAADINGKWIAQTPSSGGKKREMTFDFKVEGTKLKGTVSGAASPILEGTINGDDLSFVVVVNRGGGKFGYNYKGKVSGNEIKFTRTRSATGGEKVEFTAVRATK